MNLFVCSEQLYGNYHENKKNIFIIETRTFSQQWEEGKEDGKYAKIAFWLCKIVSNNKMNI